MWRLALVVALAGATFLCADPASAQPRKPFVYRCDDGTQLTVIFPRFRFAQLELDGKTIVLTRRVSVRVRVIPNAA
jgi:hypothetical protein